MSPPGVGGRRKEQKREGGSKGKGRKEGSGRGFGWKEALICGYSQDGPARVHLLGRWRGRENGSGAVLAYMSLE
jgi:hypothetical protein